MQTILAVSATLIVAAITDARTGAAHAAPWCARYVAGGGTNCGFYTYEQCRETISGIGGSCTPNLWEPPRPVSAFEPQGASVPVAPSRIVISLQWPTNDRLPGSIVREPT